MNNYKILFSFRILKSILTTFVDSFLVLYFLELSTGNILPLGIYKLVAMTFVFGTIFCVRNLAKSKYRVNLLRIGICFDFIYFLTILLLREKVVDYIYLVGALYGLEEGFYYSVYNMFESDGITNEERAKFTGIYTSVKSILAMIFPILMGSYIFTSGFLNAVVVVLVIVTIRIVLSFHFKDNNLPESKQTDFNQYKKIVNQNRKIRQLYKSAIYAGLTYSEGAFASIVTIYIIKIFSNSFSLGIFTSIFSILSCLIGIGFAKFMKPENYSSNIKTTTTFTLFSLVIMIMNCNMFTVIVFNFFQTISKELTTLISNHNTLSLANIENLKKEYKVEFFVGNEFFLFVGRVISQALFILMAITQSTTIMIIVFTMFLSLYELSSAEFNDEIQRTKEKQHVFKKKKMLYRKVKEKVYE